VIGILRGRTVKILRAAKDGVAIDPPLNAPGHKHRCVCRVLAAC
jgi:hypothetical protein